MDFRMDLMNVLKGSAKGQAVMEYLITYGLALFVILIVLAILVAVVLPQLKAPENCQFSQPGFSCSTKKHVIVSDTANNNLVTAIVQLDNQQDKGINIYGVLCSSDVPGDINTATFTSAGSFVDTSVTSMNAGASTPVTLNCVEPAGQQQVSLARRDLQGKHSGALRLPGRGHWRAGEAGHRDHNRHSPVVWLSSFLFLFLIFYFLFFLLRCASVACLSGHPEGFVW